MLVACQPQEVQGVGTNTPNTISATQPFTASPSETLSPTELPSFPLDDYVMVFQKNGDLYFQVGNNSPIQLTHRGEMAHSPILSDDNEVIAFISGETSVDTYAYLNILAVHTNGGEERALITPEWLAAFGKEVGVSNLSFEPGTHQLRFNVCKIKEYEDQCLANSFFVNTDTGEITEYAHNYFYISPDKKKAIDISSSHMNIVDINGSLISQNILPYKETTPVKIYPDIQWLSDSSGLIIALPASEQLSVVVGDLTYTVWLYTIENDTAIQIPLNPVPAKTFAQCAEVISESPDGNWGLYNSTEGGLYLWNLGNNLVKSYDANSYCSQPSWSSDSEHFIYGGNGKPYFVGSINGLSIPIRGVFMQWVDATHFLFADVTNKNSPKTQVGEIVENTILTYDLGSYLLIKPK
jgi:hypothetical protein